jgi:hypothetical protein
MSDEINPYEAPGAEESIDPIPGIMQSGPQGVPGPIALGWIGVVVAIGIYGLLSLLIFHNGSAPMAIMFAFTALMTPLLRLGWVIYAARQRRRHQSFWTFGARTFVLTIWIINVVLLCLDAVLIFLFVTCLAMIPRQ